jgi:TPR repeat protein
MATPMTMPLHVYGCADYPKALKLFIPLAEQGDRLAQFQVGMMIEQGQGAEPSLTQAFRVVSQSGAARGG